MGVLNVEVSLFWSRPGELWLEYYAYSSGSLLIPPPSKPVRTDGLWRSTCFELFVRPQGQDGYFEFNFSPSFEWAAYAFESYRAGMSKFPVANPEIAVTPIPTHFCLAVEVMPDLPIGALDLGLSAVIEETEGTKSYWALRHPPGKPDFHHPDCFALTLPPPDAP